MASRNEPTPKSGANEQDISRRHLLVRGLAAAVGIAFLPSSVSLNTCFAGPESEYKKAVRNWEQKRTSSSLSERFEALSEVVKTKESSAFDILVEEFLAKDSQKHQDKLLELIAPVAAEAFSGKEFRGKWDRLFASKEFSSAHLNNCWLVYSVCIWRFSKEVRQFAINSDIPIPFRVVALKILARSDLPEVPFIESALASIPTKQPLSLEEQSALVEGVAGLVKSRFRFYPIAKGASAPPILLSLIAQMDETKISARALRRVGKIIANAVGSKTIFKDAESWRAYLDGRKSGEKLKAEGYAVPDEQTQYFFGAKGTGLNFCYVIDISGSMTEPIVLPRADSATPLTPPKKNGPITRDDGNPSKDVKDPSNPALNPIPGIDELPPGKIKTRLDAAKAALIASLRKLPPDASFSIAVFGDEAKILVDEKYMLPATSQNIEAAIAAVDKLTVMGLTNLHRGLELAFDIGHKGIKKPGPTAPQSLFDGPDVVFVLSDGVPNRDSYTAKKSAGMTYLFESSDTLANSIKRWNLFANSALNFVTIGVSDASAFSYIAERTDGTLLEYGK